MYYLLARDIEDRTGFIRAMDEADICCVFHYVPLHSSPMGMQCGRAHGDLPNTAELSDRLVRLPLFVELAEGQQRVIQQIHKLLG
jgi:dTDP-4-amino-4,6-dideoxygalactose transaminase